MGTRFTTAWRSAGTHQGLLSIGGLPPIPGALSITGGALVFHPLNGTAPVAYPLYRWAGSAAHPSRESVVQLMGIAGTREDTLYLFHLDGAVLETATPGILRDLLTGAARLDSLGDAWATEQAALVDWRDSAAQYAVIAELARTAYSDTLFQLFGTPARPIGLVGDRGRRAGRLGEFITSRDSVSLSPSRMTAGSQLRHALAHELAHRWQRAARDEMRDLWQGVPPIRDSLRYGYRNTDEHQAEAVAFAVHFLQATSSPDIPTDAALELLDAYDRLVPGTTAMARRLAAERIYQQHPLSSSLLRTTSPTPEQF
ncbi:MAG: hypothetical protein H0U85_07025 [Gemmatimonadales bacterium]|nr:hypothetical protein [Gemmatimonadales bacterium]